MNLYAKLKLTHTLRIQTIVTKVEGERDESEVWNEQI